MPQMLQQCGAKIADSRAADPDSTLDVVTNYHIAQILSLRQELLEALERLKPERK